MTLKIKGINEGFKTEALIEEYLNNKYGDGYKYYFLSSKWKNHEFFRKHHT